MHGKMAYIPIFPNRYLNFFNHPPLLKVFPIFISPRYSLNFYNEYGLYRHRLPPSLLRTVR